MVIEWHFTSKAGLDVDGGDLLDDLGGRVEVDDTLVDPHLELVPGLGTLTYHLTIVNLHSSSEKNYYVTYATLEVSNQGFNQESWDWLLIFNHHNMLR